MSIKSGPNWGNSSQHRKLGEDLQNAMRIYRTGRQREPVDIILGICYGRTRTTRDKRYGYLKLVGQNFWTFISGNKSLYQEIIEPIGYRAKEHNDVFQRNYSAVANRLTREFIERFCDGEGAIDWRRLVEANSGNFDLSKHAFEIE